VASQTLTLLLGLTAIHFSAYKQTQSQILGYETGHMS